MGLESKMADKYVRIQWKRKFTSGFESTKTVLLHFESHPYPISDEAAKARGENEARKDPINKLGWSCEVKLLSRTQYDSELVS